MFTPAIGFTAVLKRIRYLVSRRNWLTPHAIRPIRPERSIFIRELDAGSCNDVELEVTALSNPYYDFERYGFHIVASPRHADILLISGPFTRSMEQAALATFHAMPDPKRVVTVGDGFDPEGIFANSYAVMPLPEEILQTIVAHIPGDPPSPQQILDVLLTLETK